MSEELNDIVVEELAGTGEETPGEKEESATQEETKLETNDSEPEGEKEKKQALPGVQKKINKLTGKVYAEKNRADAAEARLRELEQQNVPVQTGPPKLEDFDYDEDQYQNAVIQHQVQAELRKRDIENQNRTIAQEREARNREFNQRVNESGIPQDEYLESIGNIRDSQIPISADLVDAMQMDANGPHVTKYLGDNLDVLDKIANMPPVQAALEIGKISANIAVNRTKKTTNAPDPVQTAGGNSASMSKKAEDMDMSEIMADDSI